MILEWESACLLLFRVRSPKGYPKGYSSRRLLFEKATLREGFANANANDSSFKRAVVTSFWGNPRRRDLGNPANRLSHRFAYSEFGVCSYSSSFYPSFVILGKNRELVLHPNIRAKYSSDFGEWINLVLIGWGDRDWD